MADNINWSNWAAARKAIKSEGATTLVIVCLVEAWNPFSLAAATIFNQFSTESRFPGTQIFLIPYESDFKKNSEYDVYASPTALFFRNAVNIRVKRIGWEEDNKFVGLVGEKEFTNLISEVRDQSEKGHKAVTLSF
mmetsp:Transcript_46083/g.53161  ORF Transcript_46083/g.53161 Transcript_46083/m.53161 type:complete len:136 (+) Transcript_46083:73-480(+)